MGGMRSASGHTVYDFRNWEVLLLGDEIKAMIRKWARKAQRVVRVAKIRNRRQTPDQWMAHLRRSDRYLDHEDY